MHILLQLTVLTSCLQQLSAAEHNSLPLGHADFLPTTAQPIGWRGDGSGCYPGANPVSTWNQNTGENIRWKISLPFGLGQPIVIGDTIYLHVDPDVLYALDRKDGTLLWKSSDSSVSKEQFKKDYGGWVHWYGLSFPTPLSDGRHVWSLTNRQLVCYTLTGTVRWKVKVPRLAYGTKQTKPEATISPLLIAGNIVGIFRLRKASQVIAWDAASGTESWRTTVRSNGRSETNGSTMMRPIVIDNTPILMTRMGEAISPVDGRVLAQDVYKFLHESRDVPFDLISMDVVNPCNLTGLALVRCQSKRARSHWHHAGIRLRFADLHRSRIVSDILWHPRPFKKPGSLEPYAFPPAFMMHQLYHDGRWYLQGFPNMMTLDAQSGKILDWKPAATEMKSRSCWSDYPFLHMAGGYLFSGQRDGTVAVYRTDPTWELAAVNEVDKNWHSNPFFHGDSIYIRTQNALYCIGKQDKR